MMLEEWLVYLGMVLGILYVAVKSKKPHTVVLLTAILLILEFKLFSQVLDEGITYSFHNVVANTTSFVNSSNYTIENYVYKGLTEGTVNKFFSDWSMVAVLGVTLLNFIYKMQNVFGLRRL